MTAPSPAVLVPILFSITLLPGTATAQESREDRWERFGPAIHFGVVYDEVDPGDTPFDATVGASLFTLNERDWGLYGDFRIADQPDNPSRGSWTVGATRGFSRLWGVYGGGGLRHGPEIGNLPHMAGGVLWRPRPRITVQFGLGSPERMQVGVASAGLPRTLWSGVRSGLTSLGIGGGSGDGSTVAVGMTEAEVRNAWGRPDDRWVHRDGDVRTAIWLYGRERAVHFEDGRAVEVYGD